jgi:polyhydroxyalkanoate synthesis regulator phasin
LQKLLFCNEKYQRVTITLLTTEDKDTLLALINQAREAGNLVDRMGMIERDYVVLNGRINNDNEGVRKRLVEFDELRSEIDALKRKVAKIEKSLGVLAQKVLADTAKD